MKIIRHGLATKFSIIKLNWKELQNHQSVILRRLETRLLSQNNN